jgi:hypothetical protein
VVLPLRTDILGARDRYLDPGIGFIGLELENRLFSLSRLNNLFLSLP